MLLLAGLWTPIAGVLVALLALWQAFSHPGNPRSCIMLGTLGAALALLGPGGWSVDARLFGWKRIDIRDRKNWISYFRPSSDTPVNRHSFCSDLMSAMTPSGVAAR
jgi:hypothetical protein